MKISQILSLTIMLVCISALLGFQDLASSEPEDGEPADNSAISAEDQAALELGRKVIAVQLAIQNPEQPDALNAVTDLGHDQRYYVMVRGWLSYQLQGDNSIADNSNEAVPDKVKSRIDFLKTAIRAVDLE